MTSWQSILRSATAAAPHLHEEMERVILLIEGSLSDSLDTALLREVVDLTSDPLPEYSPQPPIITSLESAGDTGAHDTPSSARDALWATLRGLPGLLRALSLTLYGAPLALAGPASIFEYLRLISDEPTENDNDTYRCPRCRSRQVRSNAEKVLGVRIVELYCKRCGLSASSEQGNSHEAIWTIVTTST